MSITPSREFSSSSPLTTTSGFRRDPYIPLATRDSVQFSLLMLTGHGSLRSSYRFEQCRSLFYPGLFALPHTSLSAAQALRYQLHTRSRWICEYSCGFIVIDRMSIINWCMKQGLEGFRSVLPSPEMLRAANRSWRCSFETLRQCLPRMLTMLRSQSM